MAGFNLQLKAQDESMIEGLNALLVRFGDLTPLMARIGAYLRASTVDRFRTNVGPDGVTWKPSRRVIFQGGRTLVDRGILRDSIIDAHGSDFAAVGTNDPRALAHQLGVTIYPKNAKALAFNLPGVGFRMVKSVTLPARPYVGLNDDDRTEIEQLGVDYAQERSA